MCTPRRSLRCRCVLAVWAVVVVLAGAAPSHAGAVAAVRAPGVCSRTPQVRDRILQALDTTDCGAVVRADLGRVGALWLDDSGISQLRSGDFEGLHGLEFLDLSNNDLIALPAGVFDGLWSLELLWLSDNRLRLLSGDAFDELAALRDLRLDGNELLRLPAGVFDELSELSGLALDGNELEALPHGVFEATSGLSGLSLAHNDLTALPSKAARPRK